MGDSNGGEIKILHGSCIRPPITQINSICLKSISQTHLAMGQLYGLKYAYGILENNTVKGKYFHTNKLPHVLLKHTFDFSLICYLPVCVTLGPAVNSMLPSLLPASTMLTL